MRDYSGYHQPSLWGYGYYLAAIVMGLSILGACLAQWVP